MRLSPKQVPSGLLAKQVELFTNVELIKLCLIVSSQKARSGENKLVNH